MYIVEGNNRIFKNREEALDFAKKKVLENKHDLNKVIKKNLCKSSFNIGLTTISDELKENIKSSHIEDILVAIKHNEIIEENLEIESEKLIQLLKIVE